MSLPVNSDIDNPSQSLLIQRDGSLKVFKGHTDYISIVAFFPNGRRIASGSYDGTIRVWDIDTGQQSGEPFLQTSAVWTMALSPDGKKITSGLEDSSLVVWDVPKRKLDHELIEGHSPQVYYCVAFSPDSRFLATGLVDHTVQIWDSRTGKPVRAPFQGHSNVVWSIAFSPDALRVASGSSDNTIRVWDVASGQTIVGPLEGHTKVVSSVTYFPDGRSLISGSYDHTIRIWDAATGNAIRTLSGHGGEVNSVAVSADGKRIASGADDNTVRIWDVETGLLLGEPFTGHEKCVRSVAFSPDGTYVASGSEDRTVRLWDSQPKKSTQDLPPSPRRTSGQNHTASGSHPDNASILDLSATAATPKLPAPRPTPGKTTVRGARNAMSSLNSSVLDLPAAPDQPQPEGSNAPRPASVDSLASDDYPRHLTPNHPLPSAVHNGRIRKVWEHLKTRLPARTNTARDQVNGETDNNRGVSTLNNPTNTQEHVSGTSHGGSAAPKRHRLREIFMLNFLRRRRNPIRTSSVSGTRARTRLATTPPPEREESLPNQRVYPLYMEDSGSDSSDGNREAVPYNEPGCWDTFWEWFCYKAFT